MRTGATRPATPSDGPLVGVLARSWAGVVVSVLGVLLVSVNLRASVAATATLVGRVQAGLALDGSLVSALLSAPAVCFGVFGVLAGRVVRVAGLDRTLVGALAVLAVSLAVRPWFGTVVLFVATLTAMASVAVLNVALPVVVKRDFPGRTGVMTGVFITFYGIGASVAAATTIPLVVALAVDWRTGLAAWAVPAVAALVVWVVRLRVVPRRPDDEGAVRPAERATRMRSDRVAWAITIFTAANSVPAFVLVAWLPSMLAGFGVDPARGGFLLAALAVTGTPAALLVPAWAARHRDQRWVMAALGLLMAAGLVGLLVAPTGAPLLWVVLISIGLGGSFPLALTLVVIRSRSLADTGTLSSMAQGTGYLMAAAASLAVGEMSRLTGSWRPAIVLLLCCLAVQVVSGWSAARDRFVGDPAPTSVPVRAR